MINPEEAKARFNGVIRKKHNQGMIYISAEATKYEKASVLTKEVKETQKLGKEAPDDELVL